MYTIEAYLPYLVKFSVSLINNYEEEINKDKVIKKSLSLMNISRKKSATSATTQALSKENPVTTKVIGALPKKNVC